MFRSNPIIGVASVIENRKVASFQDRDDVHNGEDAGLLDITLFDLHEIVEQMSDVGMSVEKAVRRVGDQCGGDFSGN